MSGERPLAARVAALFTLAQLGPNEPALLFASAMVRNDLAEFVVRAAADRKPALGKEYVDAIVLCLSDPRPRLRLQAVVALARLGKTEAAPGIVRLTADPDPLVAHAAVNALVTLRAINACLAAIDPKTRELAPGAARALQGLHDVRTVDGLIEKLHASKDDTLRRPILKALCRLYAREADWDGTWWTTRPDTSGPYYRPVSWDQTKKVGQALASELGSADDVSARWLLTEMMKNKVEIEGSTARALKIASSDPVFRAATVGVLANRTDLPAEALGLLGKVAASEAELPALRGRALRGLTRSVDKPAAREAAVAALAVVGRLEKPPAELVGAWQDFVKDGRQARNLGYYAKLAEGPDPAPAELAYAVILQADANPRMQGRTKEVARDAIARALAEPALTARLLHAVGRTRSQSYAVQVRDRLTSKNPDVRLAAQEAAKRLGLDRSGGEGGGPVIAKLPVDQVVAAVEKEKGDPALGAQLFERVGCVACHTVSKIESPKGPYLGDIANRYSRAELAESVLKPSAKIAQGFETQKFATLDGQTYEGFVVSESGEEVEIRNASGAATVIPKKEIDERGKSEISVMPTGLADPLTPRELASILTYLE
ncbi:MAG: c-type cytochrome, partial [Planctomycetia bacterium]|nr:c-type cytochrome [Planctomycetia bacterium]